MADPLSSVTQVQDVPDWIKPYRNALLNAAFGAVFTPEYMRQNLPNATFWDATRQAPPQQPTGETSQGAGGDAGVEAQNRSAIANALAMTSGNMPQLLGMVWDPKTRTYVPEAYKTITRAAKGGSLSSDPIQQILDKYEDLRKEMPVGIVQDLYGANQQTGGVSYPRGTNPFGASRGPSQTSAYTTGSSFGTDLDRFNQRPDITPGIAPPVSTDVRTPPTAANPLPTTPTGGVRIAGPSAPPPIPGRSPGMSAPGIGSGSTDYRIPVGSAGESLAPVSSPGLAGTTAASRGAGGYNPLQYATDEQATGLASLLGGTTQRTNVAGPVAPPPQNLINFGGSDSFNAGLIQQQLRPGQTPSEMTGSLNLIRADVARSGGDTSAIDRLIQQNNQAYSSGLSVSPVGQPAAPSTPPASASKGKSMEYTSQPVTDNGVPEWLRELEQKPAVPYYGKGFASGGYLAQFDIGDDGKVQNYRKGGVIRKQTGGGFTGPNILGFGATQTPAAGGFGGPGGVASLFQSANPNAPQLSQNVFNAPPVYGNQRVMGFGQDFGQYTPGVGFTASNLTTGALAGAGKLPSVFRTMGQPGQEYMGIDPGSDFGKGLRSINYATDLAGEAATEGMGLIGASKLAPQDSYLMSMMPGIQKMGFADAIKVSPLQAPTMRSPSGVTTAQLRNHQMDEPMGVRGQNIDILGQLGGITGATVQGVPQVQQFQMQAPERVTGQTRDILSTLGGISGARIEGVPQVQQFQMQGPERVGAGQTQVSQFGQPQAQQYMSPYMDAVIEAQKRDASRQAAMQKASRNAAAVRAGAFGGSRQAIQEGMAEEALQRQLGDIEAVGRQKAFEGAQAQFERDRTASLASQQANVQSALQASLANQQAGLTTGRENLGSSLATQQLGTQAALQAALANQQAAQQAGLTGYGTRADILRSQSAQDLQAALANQQAGITTGRENLGANLATQQLGTQAGLQAALANQQAAQQAALTGYGTRADVLRGLSSQELQAALANQQAGLTAGRENLGARLGIQQLAAQQALQAQLANQQAGLTVDQANLQSALATQQLGTQAGLEAAKATQSGDLATWQMQLDAMKQASAEQEGARQRQFNNRLAALQQGQSGAAGLAGLGQTMMGIPGMAQQLELQRLAAMQQAGGAIDTRTQAALDLAYQDFINQQNFPYQQMNFLQGILAGVPTGMQTEGVQFQRPDTAGGLTSLAASIPGLISSFRKN